MWRRVVEDKFGEGVGKWVPNATRGPYGVSFWKAIMDGWEDISKGVKFKPGDGETILFFGMMCGWVTLPLVVNFLLYLG